MTTFALALAFTLAPVAQGDGAAQEQTAKAVFEQMLSKYKDAKTVAGRVVFEQTARSASGEKKVAIATTLAVSKPKKFAIQQTRTPADTSGTLSNSFWAVSDGTKMGYSIPKGLLPGDPPKMYEAVPDFAGVSEGLDAFAPLLLDRSFPIAVAFYNEYEMRLLLQEVVAFKFSQEKEVEYAGKRAWAIEAQYIRFRAKNGRPEVRIPIYFYISKDYDLLGMEYAENLMDGQVTYRLESRWTAQLERDAEIPQETFVVK